jgi:FtsZ-binding cell division protein ZapB
MLPKYDGLVADLKKAKESISSLRQERDGLKQQNLELDSLCTSLKRSLSALQEENSSLKSNLSKSAYSSGPLISKLTEACQAVNNFASDKFWFNKNFQTEEIVLMLQDNKIERLVTIFCDLVVDIAKGGGKMEENKGKEKVEEEDYWKLVEESEELIEKMKVQNGRIAGFSRNIEKLIAIDTFHKTTRSVASLRVPEFRRPIFEEEVEDGGGEILKKNTPYY